MKPENFAVVLRRYLEDEIQKTSFNETQKRDIFIAYDYASMKAIIECGGNNIGKIVEDLITKINDEYYRLYVKEEKK